MVHTERANGAGSPHEWCIGKRSLYNDAASEDAIHFKEAWKWSITKRSFG